MGTEIAKGGVDFGEVGAKLRERIQAAFVELIPEEKWDEMIRREVDMFMAQRPAQDSYGRVTGSSPSRFSEICSRVLGELIEVELKERVAKMDRQAIGDAVRAWVEENHQQVLGDFIRGIFAKGVDSVSANLSWYVQNNLPNWLGRR